MTDEDASRPLIGNVIEESLADRGALSEVTILKTRVETATEYHRTPWLERWTIHRVAVPEQRAAAVAERFRKALDAEHAHAWYVDFKNEEVHYIAFADKVFRVPCDSAQRYAEAIEHGMKLGILRYQLDFSPTIKRWERYSLSRGAVVGAFCAWMLNGVRIFQTVSEGEFYEVCIQYCA